MTPIKSMCEKKLKNQTPCPYRGVVKIHQNGRELHVCVQHYKYHREAEHEQCA